MLLGLASQAHSVQAGSTGSKGGLAFLCSEASVAVVTSLKSNGRCSFCPVNLEIYFVISISPAALSSIGLNDRHYARSKENELVGKDTRTKH
jgi:hypothetical protein